MSLSGTYLVTGGAGFIGSHIAGALAGRGARVRVLDDLSTGYAENLEAIGGDVDFVRGSVADAESLRRALEGVELVFHEAAIPSRPTPGRSSSASTTAKSSLAPTGLRPWPCATSTSSAPAKTLARPTP